MDKSQWIVGNALVWFLFAFLAHTAAANTISGSVQDPSGSPFKGAFVQARNVTTKITMNVLSDRQGQYKIDNLAAGEYEVKVRTRGYKSEPRTGVNLKEVQSVSLDFALQKDNVRWSDLAIYENKALLPDGKGKELLFGTCLACHGISTRMGRRSEEGWKTAVNYMLTGFKYFFRDRVTDQQAADLTAYLNRVFGEDSELPRYPEVKPREFTDEAMKIVYVDYDLPTPKTFPWSAYPDPVNGNVWIPEYNTNKLGKLDPKTGVVQEFRVPELGRVDMHSAVPAPDGTVWMAESSGVRKIAKFDPRTQTITEYQDSATASSQELGRRHTMRIDSKGHVWNSGNPVSRFDPKTGEFTRYPTGSTYGIQIDKEGNAWFTQLGENKLGKIDAKTGKVTKWTPPTPNSGTRRMKIDDQGVIWLAEYNAGKIARFDSKTETFKEYPLPGSAPTPYAFGIDKKGYLWYASYEMDVMGRLDARTGEVIEYPMPYVDNAMRELFVDSQGRMWFGTAGFNKVGYFIVKDGQ